MRTEPEILIDHCCCSFEDPKGANDRWRHSVLGLVDLEVLEGALRLRAPILVRGDLDLAESIAFGSCRGGHSV